MIGKVDEILGPINQVYFTIKGQEGIVATSFKPGDKFYIGPDKLLPLEKWVLRAVKPKRAGGASRGGPMRGGRGGRGAPRGAPRGRGGFGDRGGRGGSRGFGGRGGGFSPGRGANSRGVSRGRGFGGGRGA
ncbi:hypothetical protein LTR04_001690 [Oleoguttula sp. CCFEE 6159]|nr:hypothetical protein LTR04_001690 [Oleoguttula sp. CCFEE 6159]